MKNIQVNIRKRKFYRETIIVVVFIVLEGILLWNGFNTFFGVIAFIPAFIIAFLFDHLVFDKPNDAGS